MATSLTTSMRAFPPTNQSSIFICGDVNALNSDLASTQHRQTFVICPSHTLREEFLAQIVGGEMYETRYFSLMLHLQNPKVRMIWILATLCDPCIVDYYLSLIPGTDPEEARSRLKIIYLDDKNPKPLSKKVIERPILINRLKKMLSNEFAADESFLMVEQKGRHDVELAQMLDIDLYGPSDESELYGTKRGGRQLFREANIQHPLGTYEAKFTEEELCQDIVSVLMEAQSLKTGEETTVDNLQMEYLPNRLVIKCDEGFSGDGNCCLRVGPILEEFELEKMNAPENRRTLVEVIRSLLPTDRVIVFASDYTWPQFMGWIEQMGCIVEVWMDNVIASTCVGGFVHRSYGAVFATNDQILEDGQKHVGCFSPARAEYRLRVYEPGQKIADFLQTKGVLEEFGADFVVTKSPDDGSIDVHALEVNVRWGGRTAPSRLLYLITGGVLNPETGYVELKNGETRAYYCHDNVTSEAYVGLLPEDILNGVRNHPEINWNSETKMGCVFHFLNLLPMVGKLGVTCIAATADDAAALYEKFKKWMDDFVASSGLSEIN